MRRFLIAIAALSLVSMSWGHFTPGSLKFSRPSPYHPGDTVTVSYAVEVVHGVIDIDFSLNGKTWTSVKSGIAAKSKMTYTYKWTVGQDTTSHGKLRICQENGTKCTNADTTNDPSGAINGARYVLISPLISIVAPTSNLSQFASDAAPTLREVGPGSLELGFSLASEGPVSLIAYDAQGREAALLLRDRFSAGAHRFSLFSQALREHPAWLLRLNVAGQNQPLGR
ncbi:MAG: hypothetical protein JF616_14495 [Fibrobacteres bacterium]|nr:hypothetical protein [Fibrobacterota bacterium]